MAIGQKLHTLYSEWPVDTLITIYHCHYRTTQPDLSRKIGERSMKILFGTGREEGVCRAAGVWENDSKIVS